MAVAFTNNWLNILNKLQSVLRTEFKTIKSNALNFMCENPRFKYHTQHDRVKKDLLNLKVIKKTDSINHNTFYYFYEQVENKRIFYKLKNINDLIESNKQKIKSFNNYYKGFKPNPLKVNTYDLKLFRERNYLTNNSRTALYFYLIAYKKKKGKGYVLNKGLKNNRATNRAMNTAKGKGNILTQYTDTQIQALINIELEKQFKEVIQGKQGINITYFNQILDKQI